MTERAIGGPPAILVEILSPSSIAYDRLTKSRRYAALGVPHFWIVDIANRVFECYRNENGLCQPIARVADGGSFEHPDFAGLVINSALLWEL